MYVPIYKLVFEVERKLYTQSKLQHVGQILSTIIIQQFTFSGNLLVPHA